MTMYSFIIALISYPKFHTLDLLNIGAQGKPKFLGLNLCYVKWGATWTLPAQLGQLKTGQDGKGLLRIHLWCPYDLPRLWYRIE